MIENTITLLIIGIGSGIIVTLLLGDYNMSDIKRFFKRIFR